VPASADLRRSDITSFFNGMSDRYQIMSSRHKTIPNRSFTVEG
jgi:hypothetical protein